jgi:hypothetical protein
LNTEFPVASLFAAFDPAEAAARKAAVAKDD